MAILGGLSDRLVDSEMRAGGSRTSLASGKFASNESLHLGGGAPQEQPEVSKRITCPLGFLTTSHVKYVFWELRGFAQTVSKITL